MKKSILFLLATFAMICLISCGSTPEEPPAEEPKAPVEEVVEEDVLSPEEEAALVAEIQAARNRAIEVGAEEKLPAKLQDLDVLFEACKADKAKLNNEGKTLPASYNALADEVSALLDKENDDALKAEQELLAQQQLLEDIKNKSNEAGKLLAVIQENGLDIYAPENYQRGLDSYNALQKAFEEKTTFDASDLENAEKAYKEFMTVKTAGFKTIAREKRSTAYASKKNADSVKAGVSQKERYKKAVESFKKGDALYAMQNSDKAIEYYAAASTEFDALYTEISDKRAAALQAIEEAKKSVADSANYAAEADVSSPITGENVAGIEKEDTVLLEADNYENPEDAEIDVAETFEEQVVDTAKNVVEEASNIIENNPDSLPEAAATAVTDVVEQAVELQNEEPKVEETTEAPVETEESEATVEVGEK